MFDKLTNKFESKHKGSIKFDKLIHDSPIYKNVKESLLDNYNYGTTVSFPLGYHSGYRDVRVEYTIQSGSHGFSTMHLFWITFAIINVFAFYTFLISALIDSYANPELYAVSEGQSLMRGGEIYLIVLGCWYVIMVPIYLVILYIKKRNSAVVS